LKKDLSLAGKVAELKLLGIQDKEDLMLQYALESGVLDVNRINNLLNPEAAAKARDNMYRQMKFRRGLLNPRRLPRGDWGTHSRKANAEEALNTKLTGAERLGVDRGFSAYTPGLSGDVRNVNWEGRAHWNQLLASVPK
jgi:hypothetical protein